jgi:tRNA G18 (ribose-2'-O)-methylase SpoU
VRELHEQGYTVYAVEQAHNSVTLEQAAETMVGDSRKPVAVVLGHEVFGVQQEVIDLCDGCIEIPQYGTKHSMNVSVTAGIVIYRLSEAMRALPTLGTL